MPTLTAKYVDCGSRTKFYNIDKARGFKEFNTWADAQYAHEAQSRCSSLDLAPAVYSDIGRVTIGGKLSGWGYITEIAELINPECSGNCGCELCEEAEDKWYADIVHVCNTMYDVLGLCMEDNHSGNFGLIKRHGETHLVCIDFGFESVTTEEEEYA